MSWRRLFSKSPLQEKRILLPPDTWRVLERMAKREGKTVEKWAEEILKSRATAAERERASAEEAREKAQETMERYLDREERMEELVARAERGEFSADEWRKLCQEVQESESAWIGFGPFS